MARKQLTQFFDDITGEAINEDEAQVVRFGIDGKNYILDLSEESAAKFRDDLAPYVQVARRDRLEKRPSAAAKRRKQQERTQEIRQWAQDRGLNVADRGKLPYEVVSAYEQEHR